MSENFPPSFQKEENISVNALKSEHLLPGVSPIYCCLETFDDPHDEDKETRSEKAYKDKRPRYQVEEMDEIDHVDFFGWHHDLVKKKFKNPMYQSYVISPITEKDKMSRIYRNCTGVIVAGVDKVSGKNISFLSHQAPQYFLKDEAKMKEFSLDLKKQTEELKKRCVPGTIDSVIFGGNYFFEDDGEDTSYREDYLNSINLLSSEVSGVLGFSPVVVAGPKFVSGGDNIYYNNEQRRAFLMRPEIGNTGTESYLPEDIKKQEEKWSEEYKKEEEKKRGGEKNP